MTEGGCAVSAYETAWLIESDNGCYIGKISHCQKDPVPAHLGWVVDPNAAIRFARKIDAEEMMCICRELGIVFSETAKGATAHAWFSYAGRMKVMDTNPCEVPPNGWRCTRPRGHDGPCAAIPVRNLAENLPKI